MPEKTNVTERGRAATTMANKRWRSRAKRLVLKMGSSTRTRRGDEAALVTTPHTPPAGPNRQKLVDRIAKSVIFDHDWYNRQVGGNRGREEAIRHYLKHANSTMASPHPLFDTNYFVSSAGDALPKDVLPFVAYLNTPALRAFPTHPLFDLDGYLAANPAAQAFARGGLVHYLIFGAAAGLRPNSWYQPDPISQPSGLVDWVKGQQRNWIEARSQLPRTWRGSQDGMAGDFLANHPNLRPHVDSKSGRPLISIAIRTGLEAAALQRTLTSIAEQTVNSWEVLLLDEGHFGDLEVVARESLGGGELVILQVDPHRQADGWNCALAAANGDFIAWARSGETWVPGRIGRTVALAQASGGECSYDAIKRKNQKGATEFADRQVTAEILRNGGRLDLSRVVVSLRVAREIGFDTTLKGMSDFDFTLRLALAKRPTWIPVVGVHREVATVFKANRLSPRLRPAPDHEHHETWYDVAINRHLVDWTSQRETQSVPGRVSIIIPTYSDWQMTTTAVASVCKAADANGDDVQVIVYNNGCDLPASLMLNALAEQWEAVEVVNSPVNHGFALGNNLGLERATGEFVVFLNNDTEVETGWLAPLIDAASKPGVLGAQSLLLFPSGTIQSAGVAFPVGGGLPHELLQGFPAEDATALADVKLSALTGAALVVRRSAMVEAEGFDPLFRNGMEDVDLCLRLAANAGEGCFRVVPDSRVIHHESRTPGRFTASLSNRLLYLDRWDGKTPQDDERLWSAPGFAVTHRRIVNVVADDRRLCAREPQISRPSAWVNERTPRLRWSIKNPAPAGAAGELWGDTYFARHLADGLKSLGQDVVIDHKEEFYRASGYLDDVVVAIRGLTPFRPAYGQISLGWVISHPEMLSRAEACSYDRLFAASTVWSEEASAGWGIRVDPLLQATDPERFHPDLADPDTGHRAIFIGKSRMVMRPIVKQAIDAGVGLAVYGTEWDGFIPDSYVKDLFVPNDKVGAMYRSAGVVLNDHWEDMRTNGFLSNRLFDAVAAGARVITDDVVGLGDIFGKSVQVANSTSQLSALTSSTNLDSVFGTDEERRATAKRIATEHSFTARAQSLLTAALELHTGTPARDA